jgi:UDPglucose 6-dehydrogenase
MKIGFVGATHLSLNTGIALASIGHQCHFFDIDIKKIEDLSKGILPIFEEGLSEIFIKNKKQLSFSTDPGTLHEYKIVYVAVDIKTNTDNSSDLTELNLLVSKIEGHVKGDLVLHSQIPVGFSKEIKNKFQNTNVYYQVETLIFGQAVERVLNPERYIIGTDGNAVSTYYKDLLESMNCPILYMEYESAELAKMAINMYLVSTVSTTNMLAEICENTNAKWDQIKESLQLDKRIGKYAYLSPGLGISGGNLERDMVSIKNLSKKYGTESDLIDSWQSISTHRKNWVFQKLMEHGKNAKILAVWGLAYRVGTNSVKNSPSIELLANLKSFSVKLFDPSAKLLTTYPNVSEVDNSLAALKGVEVLIIMTPWEEFKEISESDFKRNFKGSLIIDPFKVLKFDLKSVLKLNLGE